MVGASRRHGAAGSVGAVRTRFFASAPLQGNYLHGVKKILVEIIKLLWKFLIVVVWKWLRPMLGRIVAIFFASIMLLTLLGVLLARSC